MAYAQKIIFYRQRNFSRKINATVEFLRQNIRPIGKAILYIMGPMAILNGLLFSQYLNFMFNGMSPQDPVNVQNPFYFLTNPSYVGFLILSSLSFLMNVAIMLNYLKIYNERYPEAITVVEVLNASWRDVLPLLIIGIIISVLSFFGFIAFIIPGIYLVIVLSLSIPAYFFERKGVFEAVGRSFYLIRGKWWSTFGLMFVSSILMYAVSMIFIAPFYVFYFLAIFSLTEQGSTDISAWWFQSGMTLSVMFMFLGSFLTYSIPVTALCFQYFNLVERKESVGLLSDIEQLDKTD